MNPGRGEWWHWTWNPFTGCSRGCPYCYARRFWKRQNTGPFLPTFHRARLFEPQSKQEPGVIFTGSMGEYFDPGFCNGERDEVLSVIEDTPRHQFVLLTKNERGMRRYALYLESHKIDWPANLWLGVSITGPEDTERIRMLGGIPAAHRVVSAEPYLKEIPNLIDWCATAVVDWLIIGGQTGPKKHVPLDWISPLPKRLRPLGIPLWVKSNAGMSRLRIKNWPREMIDALNERR